MIISPSRKMIFIHIHKAGGTSVEFALSTQQSWDDIILGSTELGELIDAHYGAKFGLTKHSDVTSIVRAIGFKDWEKYRVWATIREPVARVQSLFSFAKHLARSATGYDWVWTKNAEDCQKWLKSDTYPKAAPWSFPAVRAYVSAFGSKNEFSSFLRSQELLVEEGFATQWSRLIEPRTGMLAVKPIKLSDLDKQWSSICADYNYKNVDLKHENVSPAIHRQDRVLSPDDFVFIKNKFKDDYEAFEF